MLHKPRILKNVRRAMHILRDRFISFLRCRSHFFKHCFEKKEKKNIYIYIFKYFFRETISGNFWRKCRQTENGEVNFTLV